MLSLVEYVLKPIIANLLFKGKRIFYVTFAWFWRHLEQRSIKKIECWKYILRTNNDENSRYLNQFSWSNFFLVSVVIFRNFLKLCFRLILVNLLLYFCRECVCNNHFWFSPGFCAKAQTGSKLQMSSFVFCIYLGWDSQC